MEEMVLPFYLHSVIYRGGIYLAAEDSLLQI